MEKVSNMTTPPTNRPRKRLRFTKAALAAISCPPSGRVAKNGVVWVHDEEVKGLAYAVTEGG
jgi:hypothetical protein